MVRPDFLEMFDAKAVVKQEAQRFGAYALVPEGFCDPIAHLAIFLTYGYIALLMGIEANAAYGLTDMFENNGPSSIVREIAVDDLTALLN